MLRIPTQRDGYEATGTLRSIIMVDMKHCVRRPSISQLQLPVTSLFPFSPSASRDLSLCFTVGFVHHSCQFPRTYDQMHSLGHLY